MRPLGRCEQGLPIRNPALSWRGRRAVLSHGSVPGGQLWKEEKSLKANKERSSKIVWQWGGPSLPFPQELLVPRGFFFIILKNCAV